MNPEQIMTHHRTRLACVYIRQSTQQQVIHHRESLRRQRSLVQRAMDLGWCRERIVEIDEDLGQSASRSQNRIGFEKLVAEAALSHVGIILALEVSRLSRGNREWYHLLDICGITGTLLADAEGLYDPRCYDDRLLLGLKGTMSEAELHIMKQRLVEAMRAKAKRGEFRFRLPPGYIWDEAGRMQKDPDQRIRSTIELVFERFNRLGTVRKVQSSLAEEGVVMAVLSGPGHQLRWVPPSYSYLHRMFRNPMYAGAYAYGKTQVEEVLDSAQRPVKRTRVRPLGEWPVLIKDHHEGYITWEMFEKNQRRITSNRRRRATPGAPREGNALLQGLVLCGRCGRRMKVEYGYKGRTWRYCCNRHNRIAGTPICQSFGAIRLERAVERLLLEALEPLGVEAMIEATAAYVKAGEAASAHWKQRVERAVYEVDLARRQYDAVDSANRLVALELERRWEKALRELESVQSDAEVRIKALERPLSEQEKKRLEIYARNLQNLWTAPTTRLQDKKRITRCLIENVVVTVPKEGLHLKSEVHWIGGEVTPIEVPKGRTGRHRYATAPELLELIRDLAKEFSDDQIARILLRKGWRTPKGHPFTSRHVTGLRYSNGIEGTARKTLEGPDIYTAQEAGEQLGVSRDTVVRWVEAGLLKGAQKTSSAPWRIRVTEEDRKTLTAADTPEGWLPLKSAVRVLGVSHQTILQRLKSGELEGIRVKVGRRSAWRIRIDSRSCDNQPQLFE